MRRNRVDHSRNDASLWRIELARELGRFYVPRDGIRMIVLGGSPSKGLSDAYSDLDIIVYWDEIDVPWLETVPLKDLDCRRELFKEMGEGVYLESYYFGTMKVDFGHATMDSWKQWTDEVLVSHTPDPGLLGMIGGFIASIPLHGEELFNEWKERLSAYPDELARAVVRKNAFFYHRGVLEHQGLSRGDLIFFYDGACKMLKHLLSVLAGLNRVYMGTDEPRWIEYHLDRMRIRPENCWSRMKAVLLAERGKSLFELEALIDDVFDLVEAHMPEVDVSRSRHRFNLTVRPTEGRPKLR
jgi:hypothetical protein